ncbi:MAG: SH3 domain-containing protein [Peptoniphilus harei]|uniref:SH3 domain-containing protein n=1 Tax=Peptoniphilus harei TaxID=54005 RepID=UPI00254B66D3|nr:SH3 domain-containing protein [Peptoniphilus harei]MDK7754572.1 SH3 domain-containing protein [Peptoniphilus harei]MDK7760378.1 SH3 domain-containing protein [Peptoniphilus harei]MDK8270168.1 SH3 domain-containing protein [Peptoniphilus harei]MDK8338628.1 SH3 domain-containing protein [Peptoniphilus harei]
MSFFRTLPTKLSFNTSEKIQIANAELTSGDFALAIDVLNAQDSFVTNIEFAVKFKSIERSYLFNGREFYFQQAVNIAPFTRYFLDPFILDERFHEARAIDIYISKYTADGKNITCGDKKFEINLPVIPEKKRAQIKETLGDGIKTYGENQMDFWRCACGFINENETSECEFCGRNKSFVLNNLTEALINSKILNVIENTRTTDGINLKTLETHLTQTNLSKIAPTTESLKFDRTNEEAPKKPRSIPWKKIFFTLVFLIFLSIVSIFALNVVKKERNASKIEDARGLALSGNYHQALEMYNSATKDKTSPEILNEMEKLKKLVASDESFQRASSYFEEGDYIDAAYNYKKVIQEDEKNYKSAQDKLLSIENIILNEVKSSYATNRTDALLLLNSYLNVAPESAKAARLKREIESANSLQGDENQKENFEKEESDKDAAETAKKASDLLHTYRTVVTEKANLRVEPSVDSGLVKILEKGTELYVLETKIEQGQRIWCHVEVKNAISQDTMKGWISNKTLN